MEPWAEQRYRVEPGKVHAALPAERQSRFPRLVTPGNPSQGMPPTPSRHVQTGSSFPVAWIYPSGMAMTGLPPDPLQQMRGSGVG